MKPRTTTIRIVQIATGSTLTSRFSSEYAPGSRTVLQSGSSSLYALADNGRVYRLHRDEKQWIKLPPIEAGQEP